MIEASIVVAAIVGLTEAVKRTGFIDTKWSAIFAIVVGVLWSIWSGDAEMPMRVFEGVLMGLTSVGLFSSVRSVVK